MLIYQLHDTVDRMSRAGYTKRITSLHLDLHGLWSKPRIAVALDPDGPQLGRMVEGEGGQDFLEEGDSDCTDVDEEENGRSGSDSDYSDEDGVGEGDGAAAEPPAASSPPPDPDGYEWRAYPAQPSKVTDMKHSTWAPVLKFSSAELEVGMELTKEVAEVVEVGEEGGPARAVFDASGTEWSGGWFGGLPHGEGAMVWECGTRWEGEMRFGEVTGKGKYEWIDGGVYEGEALKGRRHGTGTYTMHGVRYEGGWRNGKREG